MTEITFMQLLVILFLLLSGGNGNTLKEIKPLIQDFGDEDASKAISEAEELSNVITAVRTLSAPQNKNGESSNDISSILNFFNQSNNQSPPCSYDDNGNNSNNDFGNVYNNSSEDNLQVSKNAEQQTLQTPLTPIISVAPDDILLPLIKFLTPAI